MSSQFTAAGTAQQPGPPALPESSKKHRNPWATVLYVALSVGSLGAWIPAFFGLWYLLDAIAPASEDEDQFGPYGAGLWGAFSLFTLFLPMAVNFLLIAFVREYRELKPWCFFLPLWPTMTLAALMLFSVRPPGPLIGLTLLLILGIQIAIGIWWQRRKERRMSAGVRPQA